MIGRSGKEVEWDEGKDDELRLAFLLVLSSKEFFRITYNICPLEVIVASSCYLEKCGVWQTLPSVPHRDCQAKSQFSLKELYEIYKKKWLLVPQMWCEPWVKKL